MSLKKYYFEVLLLLKTQSNYGCYLRHFQRNMPSLLMDYFKRCLSRGGWQKIAYFPLLFRSAGPLSYLEPPSAARKPAEVLRACHEEEGGGPPIGGAVPCHGACQSSRRSRRGERGNRDSNFTEIFNEICKVRSEDCGVCP